MMPVFLLQWFKQKFKKRPFGAIVAVRFCMFTYAACVTIGTLNT